jgi:ribonuclease J
VAGRAMRRVIDVSLELGLLDEASRFLDEESYQHLPRDKVVLLLTGSQGEPRAALARVATADHPRIDLAAGDILVYSAREIPGNEVAIHSIMNALTTRGVRIITDRDRLVHVSGHPRRDELREMYRWVRPRIAIPVHGEAMHLAAHAGLAREMGVETVMVIADGMMLRLAPAPAVQVDEIDAKRLYKDGRIVGDIEAIGVIERRRLAFSGHVTVAIVLDHNGDLAADPEVVLTGLPHLDLTGRRIDETVLNAVHTTLDSIPRRRRRDDDVVREAVRRAVRGSLREVWGKKPVCTVIVTVV